MLIENKILIIENDQTTSNWLVDVLTKAGYEVKAANTAQEGIRNLTTDRPDLILLEHDVHDMDYEQILNTILITPGISNIPVIILTNQDKPEEIARLFEKNIADLIVKRRDISGELLGKCAACIIRAKRTASLVSNGHMVSFFSAKGGIGTSTLCINLAYLFANQVDPETMLVVDMVLPLGSLANMLGSNKRGSVAELTSEGSPYVLTKLKRYISRMENWNLSFLQGSSDPEDAQRFNPDQVDILFQTLRLMFNYVFVDLGKTLSRVSMPVLDASDDIVIVVSPDPVTVELTMAALKFFEGVGIRKEKLFLVLNRAVGREGFSKAQLEEKFNLPIYRTVPYTENNFNLATNSNSPFTTRFPQDGATIVLEELVGKIKNRLLGDE